MKKILFVVLALAVFVVPVIFAAEGDGPGQGVFTVRDMSPRPPPLPSNVGHNSYLYVPTIDSAAIALSCSVDGTTFGTMATNYSATALIDFTYAATTGGKVLKLPDISGCRKLKITSGAAQAADRTFIVFGN